jgi:hypothetical protein
LAKDVVMDSREGSGGADGAIVAVVEEEGEQSEDGEVGLDEAVGLVDEESAERHEDEGEANPAEESSEEAKGEQRGRQREGGGNEEPGHPGAVESGEAERDDPKEPADGAHDTVGADVDRAQHIVLNCGLGRRLQGAAYGLCRRQGDRV